MTLHIRLAVVGCGVLMASTSPAAADVVTIWNAAAAGAVRVLCLTPPEAIGARAFTPVMRPEETRSRR